MYQRRGSLFEREVSRKPITNEDYFFRCLHYIHFNPVHHSFVQHPLDWAYTSLHSYLSDKPTRLKREDVLDWYGGKNSFYTQMKLSP